MTFPDRLHHLRTAQKITIPQLSIKVGIHENTLRLYERGKADPRSFMLCCLADYFHVTTDYLLGRSDRRE
ncbi:helix-turn-helix transcriptional regulator [Clostridium sp. KNHs216]|uniref:helix-turn-helix domain-containing protein n=1 Tax=Clostridium sp. KNHs216 TaxID=1550235 RepID=UPI0011514B5B|nr:helix-turn-helix transcriptional regulator [Clostridium sp. KNHs216]TQI68991.1 helix-turn-helix protein [Clostridium sp. KNHs216]